MMRGMERRASRRALALVATLALMSFMALMMVAALQVNVAQRRYVRQRHDEAAARYAAESGIGAAVRAIAGGEAVVEGRCGDAAWRAEWREEGAGRYRIRSVGLSHADDPDSARRTVDVLVTVSGDGKAELVE